MKILIAVFFLLVASIETNAAKLAAPECEVVVKLTRENNTSFLKIVDAFSCKHLMKNDVYKVFVQDFYNKYFKYDRIIKVGYYRGEAMGSSGMFGWIKWSTQAGNAIGQSSDTPVTYK
ncbi:MAG TPA: hypothetical protein DCL21_00520 [Alphaproteobacteria bacterium]|nr:hypothetical protein [Alphaproteobacteria bacterium]